MFPEKQYELFVTSEALGNLSEKEISLLKHLLKGRTIKQIAELDCRSPRTKGNELNTLESKLNCHDKSMIIVYAIELGFISIRKKENPFFTNR